MIFKFFYTIIRVLRDLEENMKIIFGLIIFFICVALSLKVGVFLFKILFTILGFIIGGSVILMLLPLGLGLGLVLLVPTIIIGIIVSIIKCIAFIF
jgi:hypothetical protein